MYINSTNLIMENNYFLNYFYQNMLFATFSKKLEILGE
jgi:hypothetical protein